MKRLLGLIGIIAVLVGIVCTTVFASYQLMPRKTVYRGDEWHFDIEEEYADVIIIPKDRKEPQVYGNGSVGRAEPEQKKYDIILLCE